MFTYDKANSAVLKDGQLLGTLSGNELTHLEKIAPAHKKQIKDLLAADGIDAVTFKLDGGKDEDEPEATAIPPCPAEDPRYGDKTPEVVAWYREHKPEEFATKYAGRKVG